jgi:hypothetical protein
MNVAELKVELTKELLNTNNTGLIKHIKALFETQENDWWDELPDEVKASAERAIKQADRGELKSHKEVMARYKKWLKK